MADTSDDLAARATEPASVTADGQTTTDRPLTELIAVDQYTAAKSAAKKRHRGLQFTQLIPPGNQPGCIIGVPFGGGVLS